MNELKEAIGNAASFAGSRPPNEAIEIGRRQTGSIVFIYYKDKYGNYYYATEAGLRFEEEMEAALLRRRKIAAEERSKKIAGASANAPAISSLR